MTQKTRATSRKAIRALLVDVSLVIRKIVERSLRQAGIDLKQVLEPASCAEHLTVLQDSVVDLILCAINLPVMHALNS